MSGADPSCGNWTEHDHMSPEQELEAWKEEHPARCARCGNPTRKLFVNPSWEICDKCWAEEQSDRDRRAGMRRRP